MEHLSTLQNTCASIPGGGTFIRHGEVLDGEKTVQIVHRIASVLRAFGNRGLLGITDLANATGLPKSTTHRLVTALVNDGIDAVAAPIFDHLGTVVASLSIGGPSERCRPKLTELIGAVTQSGQQVSQALRYIGWH